MSRKSGEKQTRNFLILLYPDSTDYNFGEVMNKVCSFPTYAFIEHNQDLLDDGTPAKVHYHVMFKTPCPALPSTIVNKLGIPDNFIQPIKSWRISCCYLVHCDERSTDLGKHRYDPEEVITNDPKFNQYIGIETESSVMAEVFEDLDKGIYKNVFDIVRSATSDPYKYSVVRRNFGILKLYMEYQDNVYTDKLLEETHRLENCIKRLGPNTLMDDTFLNEYFGGSHK